MWLRRALLICCTIAAVLGEEDIITHARPGHEFVQIQSSLGGPAPVQARAIPIEEFVTSHKIPEGVSKPSDDDEVAEDIEEARIAEQVMEQVEKLEEQVKKVGKTQKKVVDIEVIEQSLDPVDQETSASKSSSKRQAKVQLESFSDAGVLPEEGVKKPDVSRPAIESEKDSVIPGVEVSAENPTTMVPVLTTAREYRGFDFVPVNIIREDSKDAYTPYADRNFAEFSDVSLVPAGTNSRIQVKKGPNGKDYEYEYVYYYYDEDDEGKAGSASNAHDGPAKTTPGPRRGSSSNRNKYSSIERTSTVEPASNEVIPSRNTNRGRHIPSGEEVPEERLPANTRFPPRSRSNHNTGTTEPSRARGNRPRPNLDLVDSSSFRTNQEGPEFPHNLPKGPVRFLGVTPNEDNEDKPVTRTRGRPTKVQEPAPVDETVDEPARPHRRRPVAAAAVPEVEVELSRGQPAHPADEDEEEKTEAEVPASSQDNVETETKTQEEKETSPVEDSKDSEDADATTTDVPTTENPLAMDKIALDLYAFSQQGQSNLVDAATADLESDDITTVSDVEETTEIPTTTELEITTTEATTTTTTEATTTTTTTTEAPTTTTQIPTGRGKFRRPGGIGGIGGKRNRLNSNTISTTSTEASAEPTQRPRGRFGASSGGFKRPRPGQKQPVTEEVQKDTSSSVNAEKPAAPVRGRFRGTGSRNSPATTSAPSTASSSSSSSGSSAVSRPTFNKLNINRRRGRPTTVAPTTSEESQESGETGETKAQEQSTTTKPSIRPRLPGALPKTRPRPGNRINIRPRPGQTTTTTAAPEEPEATAEEPAGEGTEEETQEAPAESSPAVPSTSANPLNRLKNRNRLQVQPKAVTRTPVSLAPRRSPLLPRRKTTEAPVVETSSEQVEPEESEEIEPTETSQPEPSTAASTKHEETRGLSGLLAPRRRIAPRRPGQIISRD